MRIVSILTICFAICQDSEEDAIADLKKSFLESLLCLYSSFEQLAHDLLNSDDRFLATISALLLLRKKIP
ncbi:hypothetical protein NECAME_02063 [Necator americanus]|nr:hypothetical protein NECAME_02063 [Necator americanus]ETN81773.1 hypothetical protein NECAME_02063 [Necator americanus]